MANNYYLTIIKTVLLIALSFGLTCSKSLQSSDNSISSTGDCKLRGLAKYNLTFEGLWTQDKFPKQFPLFRPNAQWSKTIARSHSDDYSLWSIGSQATYALKQFTEKGLTDEFDKTDEQGKSGILDLFQVAPIVISVGEKWATFYADEKHHKVSMATKIVPSPDWFVGIDSLDLCQNNEWLESKTIDLNPVDAGTDKGFTFTAPNWQESNFVPIFQITSKFPEHPANSFYYPDFNELPTLARATLKRINVYEKVDDVHKHDDDKYLEGSRSEYDVVTEPEIDADQQELEEEKIIYEIDNLSHHNMEEETDSSENNNNNFAKQNPISIANNQNNDVSENDLSENNNVSENGLSDNNDISQSESQDDTDIKSSTVKAVQTTTTTQAKSTSQSNQAKDTSLRQVGKSKTVTDLPLNDFVYQNNNKYKNGQQKKGKKQRKGNKKGRNRKRKNKNRNKKYRKKPVNCILGEWADWSPCSQTCGYGKRIRVHKIFVEARNGGAECKQSPETELCGSMRTCSKWKHFSFDNWGMKAN